MPQSSNDISLPHGFDIPKDKSLSETQIHARFKNLEEEITELKKQILDLTLAGQSAAQVIPDEQTNQSTSIPDSGTNQSHDPQS